MARLGVLRTSDVRCLSSTFIGVVFVCCVFLLALQPPDYQNKISMVDLPKDEVVRSQSIPDLNPFHNDLDQSGNGGGGKKGGKGEQAKSANKSAGAEDKKVKKSKWLRDELPANKGNPSKDASGQNAKDAQSQRSSSNDSNKRDVPAFNPQQQEQKQDEASKPSAANNGPGHDNKASTKEHTPAKTNDGSNLANAKDNDNQHSTNGDETDSAQTKQAEPSDITDGSASRTGSLIQKRDKDDKEPQSQPKDEKNTLEVLSDVLAKSPGTMGDGGGGSLFSNLGQSPLSSFSSPFIGADKELILPQVEKKIITWHHADDAARDLTRMRKALEHCPEAACQVMYPLPPEYAADAVIFNQIDVRSSPSTRTSPDQAFVFHELRSPSALPKKSWEWTTDWNAAFNWTWTYRRDSDIWQPFGMLKEASKVRAQDYFNQLSKEKTRPVVWMPDTCYGLEEDTPSKRQQFVSALRRYLPITEYGTCVNKTCSDRAKGRGSTSSSSCSSMLTKKFFFLLALEDDLCRDHVTEVFYRAWQEGTHVVPVVRGGADYAAYFPEGTYIDVDWFDTVQDLADFLSEVMRSRKLYAQLLWRKAHWVSAGRKLEESGLCHLCYKLHHLPSSKKRIPDLRRWYERGACKVPRPIS